MRTMRKGVSCWDCGQWLHGPFNKHHEAVERCDECYAFFVALPVTASSSSQKGESVLAEPTSNRHQVNSSYPYRQLEFPF